MVGKPIPVTGSCRTHRRPSLQADTKGRTVIVLALGAAATLQQLFSHSPILLTAEIIFSRTAAEYLKSFEFRERNVLKNEIGRSCHTWNE